MTDRYAGLFVVLESDIREDDAEPLIAAIKMLRGVLDVKAHVADMGTYIAESRAAFDIENRVLEALRGKRDKA